MAKLTLLRALTVLDKASRHAVATQTETDLGAELTRFRDWLYLRDLRIQQKLENYLSSPPPNLKFLFLCGSSGDGKSELIRQLREANYLDGQFDFHPDATHSDSEDTHGNLQTLDRKFREADSVEKAGRILVTGINLGLMSNYSSHHGENEEVHREIKQAFRLRLETPGELNSNSRIAFFDFADHPRFTYEPDEARFSCEFAEKFLAKLTEKSDQNPYRNLVEEERQALDSIRSRAHRQAIINFQLLCDPSIQRFIVETVIMAHLSKSFVFTARAFRDFVYRLVVTPDYLLSNLYALSSHEWGEAIAIFDPCRRDDHLVDDVLLWAGSDVAVNEIESIFQNWLEIPPRHLGINKSNPATHLIRLLACKPAPSRITLPPRVERLATNLKYAADYEDYLRVWRTANDPELVKMSSLNMFKRDLKIATRSHLNRGIYFKRQEVHKKQISIRNNERRALVSPTKQLRFDLAPNQAGLVEYFQIVVKGGANIAPLQINIDFELFRLIRAIAHGLEAHSLLSSGSRNAFERICRAVKRVVSKTTEIKFEPLRNSLGTPGHYEIEYDDEDQQFRDE